MKEESWSIDPSPPVAARPASLQSRQNKKDTLQRSWPDRQTEFRAR
jgi:hypothetical protein